MKKVLLSIVMVLSMFVFTTGVNAAAKTGITDKECSTFASRSTTIYGSQNINSCYRASCNGGNVLYTNMVQPNYRRFTCGNGNTDPLVKVVENACDSIKLTCPSNSLEYCEKVESYDCDRTSNGSTYASKTEAPTQAPAPVVITEAPTQAPAETTTKATTTKKKTGTKKTTKATTAEITTTEEITTTTTEAPKSNNTNIKVIKMNGVDIGYKNTKNNYTVKLPYDIADVEVIVDLEDPTATSSVVGNTNMPNEDSEITVSVVAEDGTKKDVSIKVKRYSGESSDCTLANIYIEDYNIDFSKNVYDYKLSVPKSVNSLDLSVVPTDEEKARYEVLGNEKLTNKSVITINVVAQDGSECDYTITINKKSNTWKYVLLIIILVGALATSIYFLYKYMKKSKGNYKYE